MLKPHELEERKKGIILAGIVLALASGLLVSGMKLDASNELEVQIKLLNVSDPDHLGRFTQARLQLHNSGEDGLKPLFGSLRTTTKIFARWKIVEGERELGPGENSTYLIEPFHRSAAIPYGDEFVFSVSESREEPDHYALSPTYRIERQLEGLQNPDFLDLSDSHIENKWDVKSDIARRGRVDADWKNSNVRLDAWSPGNLDFARIYYSQRAEQSEELYVRVKPLTLTGIASSTGVRIRPDSREQKILRFVFSNTSSSRVDESDRVTTVLLPSQNGTWNYHALNIGKYLSTSGNGSAPEKLKVEVFAEAGERGHSAVIFDYLSTSPRFNTGPPN